MIRLLEIMSDQIASVSPECSVQNAVIRMLDENVNSLMVVTPEGRLVGTISESELLPAIYDSHMRQTPVSLHMNRDFSHVSAEMPIEEAANHFVLHRTRVLPVLDCGKLVGVVGRRDLMKAIFVPSSDLAVADSVQTES